MKFLKNKWYSLLFADDLCSFYIFKSKKTTAKQIQLYFDSIENWLRKWRLMMAPHKCNFIVFSGKKSEKIEDEFDLKIFDNKIEKSENTTFLGVRFDKYLTFKHQIKYLKEACLKRINVLKVLSNKSWGISTKTLMQIYNSLIRSLMEYSGIIYPLFSFSNLELLERIQFKCLKIINRKSKYASNIEIKNLDGFVSIEDRFDELNLRYIRNSLSNNNELIIDLLSDYQRYSSSQFYTNKHLFVNTYRFFKTNNSKFNY